MLKSLFCFQVILAALLFPQGHDQRKSSTEYLLTRLGVSEDVKQKFIEAKEAVGKKRQLLKLDMQQLEIELQRILISHSSDMGKIRGNCEARGKIWVSLQMLEFESDGQIRGLLTPEQFKQYINFKMELMKRRKLKQSQKQKQGGQHHGKKRQMDRPR